MDKDAVIINLNSVKQKLYSLFNNSDYEFKKYKITSRLLPKIDDDFIILGKQKDGNIVITYDYQSVLEFCYYEDIIVMDKKLLDIIDTTIQFFLNYTNNVDFVKEIIKYINSLLDYDISSRYDVFLYYESDMIQKND
jgi:hypothetical protein